MNFDIVPGAGITHLADKDVKVTVAVNISYFAGMAVDNVTELVSYPFFAVPFVPVCISVHIAGAKDDLGSASFNQLAGGTLCKRHIAVDNIFLVIGTGGVLKPSASTDDVEFAVEVDIDWDGGEAFPFASGCPGVNRG
jgi:hypothetical protein